jgi:putative SOS response-associated peptidase YedK
MITTEANSLVRPIHDRMPAILGREAIGIWLHDDRPQRALAPHAPAAMDIHQVSRKVFSQANDSAELIEPLIATEPTLRARA